MYANNLMVFVCITHNLMLQQPAIKL
ncbi:hypothetical protein PENFLA_c069G01064 [Penicillium flavigenum]|uniref:Uncharacterized protein n=1 Tax=Penicillium flavigenum TaxID=254877 RepID=A0A1V6SDS8_9EURO|nr:hypothetical protein PENFLA_c069G01064 [Penicillium flavigenum]